MIEQRQQAYLEAMDIQLWLPRQLEQNESPIVQAAVTQAVTVDSPAIQSPVDQAPVAQAPVDQAPAASGSGLKLGAGSGGTLLICAVDTHSASKLANDVSRSLGNVPVWGWPDSGADSVKPLDAVAENLFTTVAVFGEELAGQIFGHDLPGNLNSARLVVLPAMHELEARQDARRNLWATMCRSGMVTASQNAG